MGNKIFAIHNKMGLFVAISPVNGHVWLTHNIAVAKFWDMHLFAQDFLEYIQERNLLENSDNLEVGAFGLTELLK